MIWAFEFEPGAERDLRKLGPAAAKKIRDYLEKRIAPAKDPTVFGKPLRRDLRGLWRFRVEDYRIICRIEQRRLVVMIVAVGHRSDVYD